MEAIHNDNEEVNKHIDFYNHSNNNNSNAVDNLYHMEFGATFRMDKVFENKH